MQLILDSVNYLPCDGPDRQVSSSLAWLPDLPCPPPVAARRIVSCAVFLLDYGLNGVAGADCHAAPRPGWISRGWRELHSSLDYLSPDLSLLTESAPNKSDPRLSLLLRKFGILIGRDWFHLGASQDQVTWQ